MTAPRPYVDQESYKLLANKATLNQGTVDIFSGHFAIFFIITFKFDQKVHITDFAKMWIS